MDKFVIRQPRTREHPEEDTQTEPTVKKACLSSSEARIRQYKDKLQFNPAWSNKWPWMEYSEDQGGMFCSVCKKHGKIPVQARGAWVQRPISNWVKATELLSKHANSDWHKTAVEKSVLADAAEQQGDIMQQIERISEDEKRRNLIVVKKLVRSLYFLVKHRIPHTTTFNDIVTLQIENGDKNLSSIEIYVPEMLLTCPILL